MVYPGTTITSASTFSDWDPWPSWNIEIYSTTATAIPAHVHTIWRYWNSAPTTTTASTTPARTIWRYWTSTPTTDTITLVHWSENIKQPTPEQLQAQLSQERERRRAAEAYAAAERKAKDKAETILRQHLTPKQVEDLNSKNSFRLESISKDGQRRTYEIKRGRIGNVYLLGPGDKQVEKYCIHPRMNVPDADSMLTQKLLLEADEETFLRVANRTRLG